MNTTRKDQKGRRKISYKISDETTAETRVSDLNSSFDGDTDL